MDGSLRADRGASTATLATLLIDHALSVMYGDDPYVADLHAFPASLASIVDQDAKSG